MDLEQELLRLRGENIAVQSILAGLCIGVAQLSDPHRAAVAFAFDYADQAAEMSAFQMGGEASALHLRTFAEVIEELRSVVLG